ncbi:MAG: hypothetical protein OSA98_16560 [Rubripirellula sp.]|nr:hypothetical protein [Rubripirellula sp.]
MLRASLILIVGFACSAGQISCHGQMITTAAPFNNISSSFFENNSINWSLRGKNWFANSGGGPLLPPFGGTAGGTAVAGGLSGGFGFSGGGVRGSLGFNFAQGSTRSISSTTPYLTTMDGYPGSISSGVLQPFVTGYFPIVGNYTAATAPLNSSRRAAAEISQQQVSNLRQAQAKRYNGKLAQYLLRAEQGEAAGNKRMARANYRLAISIAAEPLRSKLQQRLARMMSEPAKPTNADDGN